MRTVLMRRKEVKVENYGSMLNEQDTVSSLTFLRQHSLRSSYIDC